MARKPTTWTDREVARIIEARDRLALAERAPGGFADLQSFSMGWFHAEIRFLGAAVGATKSRPLARRELQKLARRINQAPMNLESARRAWEGRVL